MVRHYFHWNWCRHQFLELGSIPTANQGPGKRQRPHLQGHLLFLIFQTNMHSVGKAGTDTGILIYQWWLYKQFKTFLQYNKAIFIKILNEFPYGSSKSTENKSTVTSRYSCLENPMDGGAWWAAVHGVTEGWTWLSDFTFTFHFLCIGEGNGNRLQCSCLENPRDGIAWWAAIYGVA